MDIKKRLKYIIGWSLIILGIVGLFLPILQGLLLVIAGVAVLESEKEVKFFKKIRSYFKKKWKK